MSREKLVEQLAHNTSLADVIRYWPKKHEINKSVIDYICGGEVNNTNHIYYENTTRTYTILEAIRYIIPTTFKSITVKHESLRDLLTAYQSKHGYTETLKDVIKHFTPNKILITIGKTKTANWLMGNDNVD